MKTIVLCGGGTAGHIIPALALLPELRKHFARIAWIGGFGGMEEKLAKSNGIEFYAVTCPKLLRSLSFKNLSLPFRLFRGVREAEKALRELKPLIVFSKGGYVSVPTVMAAHRLGIPVVAHESDYSPGLANRLSARYCECVCASFESCAKKFGKKGVYTKSPIRRSLLFGNRENAYAALKTDKNKPTVLFMGGSSGAKFLNGVLRKSLNSLLKKYNVIHICGKGNLSGLNINGYAEIEFTENIADIFAAADFVVCRAGSNTVFELLCLKKPMLLVPLPKGISRGDQVENALYFTRKNCAHMVNQQDLTSERLLKEIESLETGKNSIIESIKKQDITPGTVNVLKQILKYSKI